MAALPATAIRRRPRNNLISLIKMFPGSAKRCRTKEPCPNPEEVDSPYSVNLGGGWNQIKRDKPEKVLALRADGTAGPRVSSGAGGLREELLAVKEAFLHRIQAPQ